AGVVCHAAFGGPGVVVSLHGRPERRALMYHNVSPAGPFEPYDARFAGLLRAGREEVAALAPRVELAYAASGYNGRELATMGYADVRVAPLAVDTDRLLDIEPDPATARHLEDEVKGPVVLVVGQLLPHKPPGFLVGVYPALV